MSTRLAYATGDDSDSKTRAEKLLQVLFEVPDADRAPLALLPISRWVGSVRNVGMFFLRQVASREEGGETFLRERLCRAPLSIFRWTLVDSRISAFTAGSRLPQVRLLGC